MSIRIMVPLWLATEEFTERCNNNGIRFRKGRYRSSWCIYVKSSRDQQQVKSIMNTMSKELDDEIKFETEVYKGRRAI